MYLKHHPSFHLSYRGGRGLKVAWARDDNVGFMDRWNPLSSKIPHTIFASHILVRRNKVKNKPDLDIETVVPELERAVQEYQRAHGKVSFGCKADFTSVRISMVFAWGIAAGRVKEFSRTSAARKHLKEATADPITF